MLNKKLVIIRKIYYYKAMRRATGGMKWETTREHVGKKNVDRLGTAYLWCSGGF